MENKEPLQENETEELKELTDEEMEMASGGAKSIGGPRGPGGKGASYCKYCKKPFPSEETCESHEKSCSKRI